MQRFTTALAQSERQFQRIEADHNLLKEEYEQLEVTNFTKQKQLKEEIK